jgi:hypothetical protein
MTDVRKEFSFEDKTQVELVSRYEELRAIALAKGDDCESEILKEMVVLCQVMRRRSSGPPKVAKLKALPTIADL